MTAPLSLALAMAIIALVAATVFYGRIAWHRHLSRVAVEKASGNMQIRNRMLVFVGRRTEHLDRIERAETMYGWVWIAMTRHPPDPFIQQIGWAATRRGALRGLNRYRDGERGEITDIILAGLGLLVAASFLSSVVADLTVGEIRDWLLSVLEHIWHTFAA